MSPKGSKMVLGLPLMCCVVVLKLIPKIQKTDLSFLSKRKIKLDSL